MPINRPRIVSFSGIDGAGKTTQIELLCRFLDERGVRFKLYTFWDDVASLPSLRERMSCRVFKGDQGVGSPASPVRRRDKNVRSWYTTAARFLLYALDAVKLRSFVRRLDNRAEVVIFDRYLDDELANLPLGNQLARFYVRMLLRFVPRPDVALLLDADPESATSRKPEYPLDFVRRNREAYISLSRISRMTVVAPATVGATAEMVRDLVYPEGLQLGRAMPCPPAELSCFQAKTSASND